MLLDTSGLLCYLDASERRHRESVALYDSAPVRVTHNYVIAEFVALAHVRGYPRQSAIQFCEVLSSDPDVQFLWVDRGLHVEALMLLHSRLDKAYSLCDAVSFIVMGNHHITTALTTDRHFAQAGFQALLMG